MLEEHGVCSFLKAVLYVDLGNYVVIPRSNLLEGCNRSFFSHETAIDFLVLREAFDIFVVRATLFGQVIIMEMYNFFRCNLLIETAFNVSG